MNIKTTFFFASLLTLVSLPTLSLAQDFGQMSPGDGSEDGFDFPDFDPAPKRKGDSPLNQGRLRLGLDAALSIPTTGWGPLARLGIGGLAHIEYSTLDVLYVTGRAGFIYHLAKSDEGGSINYSEIPVLGGLKWYAVPLIFFSGEIGLVVLRISGESKPAPGETQQSGSISKTFLALNLGMGIQINRHLDLRAGFFFVRPFKASEFMVGAGYSF